MAPNPIVRATTAATTAAPKADTKAGAVNPYAKTYLALRQELLDGVVAIYLLLSPKTTNYVYGGQTTNAKTRAKGHVSRASKCTMLVKRIKEWAQEGYVFDPAEHMVLVPELPNGVPEGRADEFECYAISTYHTVFHPVDAPECCNQTIGNHASKMDYKQCCKDIANNTVFKRHTSTVAFAERAAELAILEVQEAAAAISVEEVPKIVETHAAIEAALQLAISARQEAEVGALEYLEGEVAAMATRPMTQEVSIHETDTILTKFYNKLKAEVDVDACGADKGILKITRDKLRFLNSSDGSIEALLTVQLVKTELQGLVYALEIREIKAKQRVHAHIMSSKGNGRCEPVNIINGLVAAFHWSTEHGGKNPSYAAEDRKAPKDETDDEKAKREADQRKEVKHGRFLAHCKGKWKNHLEKEARWLFRHHAKVLDFFDGNRTDKGAELARQVNAFLLKGYKHAQEPFAEGKFFPCTGANESMHTKMHNLVYGRGSKEHLDIAVAGLPETRALWYLNAWTSKQEKTERQNAEQSELRRQRKQESRGKAIERYPRQKRKVDETEETGEGSTSTETKEEKEDMGEEA